MPSPFPGMNPDLEQRDVWEAFHQNVMTRAQEQLNGVVGGAYLVKLEVRLYLHEVSSDERRDFGRGDAGLVIERGDRPVATGAVATAAPQELAFPGVEVERQSSVEIVDRRNRRVVTVIELLSPANKSPGPDRDDYLRKRNCLCDQRVDVVEIDLRRGGTRPWPLEIPPCDYYALVSRWEARPKLGFWPIGLRDRLPALPIPLAAPDPNVSPDLQGLIHRVYDAAGYERYISDGTPEPPLPDADAVRARQVVGQG